MTPSAAKADESCSSVCSPSVLDPSQFDHEIPTSKVPWRTATQWLHCAKNHIYEQAFSMVNVMPPLKTAVLELEGLPMTVNYRQSRKQKTQFVKYAWIPETLNVTFIGAICRAENVVEINVLCQVAMNASIQRSYKCNLRGRIFRMLWIGISAQLT